jgi:S1 RNA binding domain protein
MTDDNLQEAAEPGAGAETPEAEPAPSDPIEVGAAIFVTVSRITPYGAFVELPDGRSGLIHISEIDRNYVKDVHDYLREGDRVEAKITAIKEDGKIDLSIKQMQEPVPVSRGTNPELEHMLKKFMRQSEERQVDVKRSVMHKRK